MCLLLSPVSVPTNRPFPERCCNWSHLRLVHAAAGSEQVVPDADAAPCTCGDGRRTGTTGTRGWCRAARHASSSLVSLLSFQHFHSLLAAPPRFL